MTNNQKTLSWKLLEHPADIRIEVYGKSAEQVFVNSAVAMTSIITGTTEHPPKLSSKKLVLVSDSLQDLLVDWLRELLFLLTVERFVFCDASLKIDETNPIEAIVLGYFVEFPDQFRDGVEIKGVTYHGLLFEKTCDGFVAQVIFDV
ncbi:MAG: archease [Pseudomonadota bacterium]